MSKDISTTAFTILLLACAPVLVPIVLLMPPSDAMRERRLAKAAEVRAQIVAACRAGDVGRVRTLARKWDRIDVRDHRADEILVVMSAVSMTDREKLRHVARRASAPPW